MKVLRSRFLESLDSFVSNRLEIPTTGSSRTRLVSRRDRVEIEISLNLCLRKIFEISGRLCRIFIKIFAEISKISGNFKDFSKSHIDSHIEKSERINGHLWYRNTLL